METQKNCSGCGKPLAPTAPGGLCPECLIKAGLGSGVDIGPETEAGRPKIPFTPPKPGELAPHFPQLEILEFIGQGGMGAVYQARQKQLDRIVALKILPPQVATGPGFAERFSREARALAKLNHPHIVTLYEFGQTDGLYYFLMEYVDGINLQQLLRAGHIAPNEALAIVPQICDALQFAHQRGIVHRDIKPGNILLSKAGQVKIADFGVAKIIAEGLDETAAGKAAGISSELTEAGSVLGTPQYMAPEQAAHPLAVDHRADIYSLGVVFYQMLTGELPAGKFEPPSKKVVIDVRLDEVVLRALQQQPELRYQQASEVKTRVEAIAATAAAGAVPHITSADLNRIRWKTGLWGSALTAAGFSMNFVFGICGALLFATSTTLALISGDNSKMLRIAKRLISINGMVMASAAIWIAFITPMLPTPWLVAIVTACFGGIVYCLSCWIKTKTEAVIGIVAGLMIGAMTGAVTHSHWHPFDEASWAFDSRALIKDTAIVALRPASGGAGQGGFFRTSDNKVEGHNLSLRTLMSYAYGPPTAYLHWSGIRVVLSPDVPNENFDLVLSAPDHPQKALQEQIKKQLGLTAHTESRQADILLLTVSKNRGGGTLMMAEGGDNSDSRPGAGKFKFVGMPIGDLSDYLEGTIGKPVVDDTGLTQKYSGSLKWDPQSDPLTNQMAIRDALMSQLGLELVPRHQPVEMLMVEKSQ
jgi:uncharacterized protein (TIGR03435 family)